MKIKQQVGLTSQIWQIVIDDSSSTTGAGLTGLVAGDVTAQYKKQGDANWTTISLSAATAGTYQSGGFVESDSGAGGGYEFHPPNAAINKEGKVWIELFGATNMAPVRIEVELDAIPYQNIPKPGQEMPPDVTDFGTMIAYLYKLAINQRVQKEDELEVYNDAGSAVDQKSSLDRGTPGQVTIGKFTTGP